MTNWHEANQRALGAALQWLSTRLRRQVEDTADLRQAEAEAFAGWETAANAMPAPAALDQLGSIFNLSAFEKQLLLLCAGVELDTQIGRFCATVQGDEQRTYPTFGLALALFDEPNWNALTPIAPLRHWRLIEVEPGRILTASPLRINERILHALTGVQYLDETLAVYVQPVRVSGDLVPSHRQLALELAKQLATQDPPLVLLSGAETGIKRQIVAAACAAAGLHLCVMHAGNTPSTAAELDGLARLWMREALLTGAILLIDAGDDVHEAELARLLEAISTPVIVITPERKLTVHRPVMLLEVGKPTTAEQRQRWQERLGTHLNDRLERMTTYFDFDIDTIDAACLQVSGRLNDEPTGLETALWDACREHTRPYLTRLTQRLRTLATWDDLILPQNQRQTLQEIAIQVRQRGKVYGNWGLADRVANGLGITALFSGPSGTGKTMASEVLANELRLDLYRVDLSTTVSKYIGETEKNLRTIFDAAEAGGAILLFDEADALFGKRSEVKDSHDRYSNIEVSYLLQRMEQFRGLAILTTNMKNALDPAFLRRIRFVVNFPFPDTPQRIEIWRHIFPTTTPTHGLDLARLARLNVAGGNIRNIAINAAFLAAEANEPVTMGHLLQATRSECAKIDKTLTEAEVGGWV